MSKTDPITQCIAYDAERSRHRTHASTKIKYECDPGRAGPDGSILEAGQHNTQAPAASPRPRLVTLCCMLAGV